MVRGLPLERLWCTLLIAGLVVWASVADAGRTSRPTGKGATRDDSVYCQNSPGQPARPEYHGTGSQNPFGGECGPGPQRQEQPQEEAEDDSCPVQEASLRPAGIILVADQQAQPRIARGNARLPGLWIAAGSGRWQQVLTPEQAGVQGLTLLGKAIFKEMACHKTRMFRFTDKQRLKDTIRMRVAIVKLMQKRVQDSRAGTRETDFACGINPPRSIWEPYVEPVRATLGFAVRSKPGVSAHDAVEAFRAQHTALDCHSGIQLTVLDAADQILTAGGFNALHPQRAWPHFVPQRSDGTPAHYALAGLGVALVWPEATAVGSVPIKLEIHSYRRYTSLSEHLRVVRFHVPFGEHNQDSADRLTDDPRAGSIKVGDMVQGDWAYIKNVPQYEKLFPGGANAGENVFYIGEVTTAEEPRARAFFGIGLEQLHEPGEPPRFQTELDLKKHLAKMFNESPFNFLGPLGSGRTFEAKPEDMVWTRLGGPTLDHKYPDEAGPFVPTVN
jgi:hypothetical protein